MKRSRRELYSDMAIHMDSFENNQITLFSCFTSTPTTGMGLPKKGVSSYCEFPHSLKVNVTRSLN